MRVLNQHHIFSFDDVFSATPTTSAVTHRRPRDVDRPQPVFIHELHQQGLRQSDLSQMYATAKMFPAGARPEGVPYNLLLLATRMIRKFPELSMQPHVALGEIRRLGLSQHRDVCRHFAQMNRFAHLRQALPTGISGGGEGVIDAAHHGRFQDLLHRAPDGAAKIISVDPPYVYSDTSHRGYRSVSARSQRCDSNHQVRYRQAKRLVVAARDDRPLGEVAAVVHHVGRRNGAVLSLDRHDPMIRPPPRNTCNRVSTSISSNSKCC
ncbi:MAG: hypothetical protein WBD40_18730 [Tepidisphaeraceae bacterium]